MRVPAPILDEKEFLRLVKENPVFLTSGNGIHDINIFRRRKRVSQGDGFLGNVLSKYGPKIFPFLKKYIFPAAKQMGGDMISDISSGRSTFKKSLKKRGLQSLGNVTRKVMTGEGRGRRAGVKSTTTTTRMGGRRTSTRMMTRKSTGTGLGRGRRLMSTSRSLSGTLVKRKKKMSRGQTLNARKRQFKKTISWKKKVFEKE